MEYRVFRNPEPKTGSDGAPKPFGKRTGLVETAAEKITVGRALAALLLGLALGFLGLALAPSF